VGRNRGLLLRYTRIGLELKAVGSNPSAAFLYGLRPSPFMLLAMLLREDSPVSPAICR